MEPGAKQSNRKAGFTIIELLTVMSVIIILIGVLVPALNIVRRFAKDVMQKNQFHSIEVAMETYNAEWEEYPPSEHIMPPAVSNHYCGAMKLCEAMVGQDLLGFHPSSRFEYPDTTLYGITGDLDLSGRRPYLKAESANATKLQELYANYTPFDADVLVLCDVYATVTVRSTGKLVGMPILYYRANSTKTRHDFSNPEESIYDYRNNQILVALGKPWEALPPPAPESMHALLNPEVFYERTRNDKIDLNHDGIGDRPYKADSYILISAGWDGEYGTDDDIFNFRVGQ